MFWGRARTACLGAGVMEHSTGVVEHLAHLDAPVGHLGPGGLYVGDDELETFSRARCGQGDPAAEDDRARRARRGQLHDPEAAVTGEIGVQAPPERLIKALGPVHIGHGDHHYFEFHVHVSVLLSVGVDGHAPPVGRRSTVHLRARVVQVQAHIRSGGRLVAGDVVLRQPACMARSIERLMTVALSSRCSIRRTRRAGAFSAGDVLSEFGLGNGPGGVDEPDVAEGLGEVAQELSADGIDLLGEQADVVDEGCGPFEDGTGPSRLSGPGQGLGQPEGAQQECAFFALEPVVGPVAVHQSPLVGEAFFGRLDRGQHPGLVGGKEPHQVAASGWRRRARPSRRTG